MDRWASFLSLSLSEAGAHNEELKDKNWISTQTVESAFLLFKGGIVGNYQFQISQDPVTTHPLLVFPLVEGFCPHESSITANLLG